MADEDGVRAAQPPADEAVLRYLAALETRRTAPGTLPQPDAAAAALADLTPPARDPAGLESLLGAWTPGSDDFVLRLEAVFVAEAAAYGRRHGVGYDAWRRAGVSADVLERAGISPDDG